MGTEERAEMLDRALEATREATREAMERGDTAEVVGVVLGWCMENGWSEADAKRTTMPELNEALERKRSQHTAQMDQERAAADAAQQLMDTCERASFHPFGMSVGEIIARMDAQGELTDDERRRFAAVGDLTVEAPE